MPVIKDESIITIKLSSASPVSLERAQAAINEVIGRTVPLDGFAVTIQLKGCPPRLVDKVPEIKELLMDHRGVDAEVTVKRKESLMANDNATFWDEDERSARREETTITMSGGGQSVSLSGDEFDRAVRNLNKAA